MTAPGAETSERSGADASAASGALPLRAVQAIALVFLAAKLLLFVVQRPFMDETYYFLWGQHPALSYYDHPGLVGWTEGLSAAIFGWNVVALRAPAVLTLLGDLGFLYLFARRMAGAGWREAFWLSAALFLSIPIVVTLTGTALPDHLLIFTCLAALYFFQGLLTSLDAGVPRWRWLYAGAAIAGLAVLAKYYGALIGAGFLVAVLVTPRYRTLFRSPHLYLAMALALALQIPTVIWNAANGFASFGFIFASRQGAARWGAQSGIPGYLIGVALGLSPFLVWPVVRFVIDRRHPPARAGQAVAALSTLLFFAASVVTNTIIHWNSLAYVAPTPFLGAFVRSRALLIAHFVYGAALFALIACNYAIVPLVDLVGQGSDPASSAGYGTEEVAAEVAALKASVGADFVAGTDYSIASEVGFALRDRDVVSLADKTEAFDFWTDYAALKGKTAIVVTDQSHPLGQDVRARFASVDAAGTIEVTGLGKLIDRYVFYVARGFAGAAQP